jgi:hypothetical protein
MANWGPRNRLKVLRASLQRPIRVNPDFSRSQATKSADCSRPVVALPCGDGRWFRKESPPALCRCNSLVA